MTHQHTPAPWAVGERITNQGFDRTTVVAKTLIAEVYSEAFRDVEGEKANAHLIAAAPELLEALEALTVNSYMQTEQEAYEMAKTAIAKAKNIDS